ncbi:CpaF family protein [Streptantibioticus ferralitis]|uniref:ATPase, T2SS/T4P/T4SS family n=1 Tax=Streptantibioticus ferralitis TaxID=236510 RepID=A0ABT5Z3H6_9ACTN|nr:ATPase, T2SS/T4P/T4SS family [Streptantibioticus ferralitis]MDF2258382.1 ATPase, T2SS/T4P/T4SS family [Streptantibioticus ferralitis]
MNQPSNNRALPQGGVIKVQDSGWRRQEGVRLPGPDDLAGAGLPVDSPAELLRRHLRQQLSVRLSQRIRAEEDAGRPPMTPQQRRVEAEAILADAAESHAHQQLTRGGGVVTPEVEQQVIASVLDEVFGLAGLEPLLRNPEIENININGERVFVRYADGHREQLPPVVGSDTELIQLIRDLAAHAGVEERRFDRGSPGVNFQLPSGERVFAVMAVTTRPSVSIRRHRYTKITLAQLRQMGTIDPVLESLLGAIVRARKNVLVTGGTAIGKTTMLRALAAEIPPWERLVTIEDTFELGLDADGDAHPDVVAMQAREANIEGQGAVSQSELVRWALRMSPDRVIVGEVRGPEVIPMCNAMTQGNDGSMATLHASTSHGAFTKLAAYAVQGPERLPLEATNLLVAAALDFVIHLDKPRSQTSKRVVSSIREVVDADDKQIVSNEVFRPGPDLRAVPGVPLRSETVQELMAAGFDADLVQRPEWWWRG